MDAFTKRQFSYARIVVVTVLWGYAILCVVKPEWVVAMKAWETALVKAYPILRLF
jgi:hypothetical protein